MMKKGICWISAGSKDHPKYLMDYGRRMTWINLFPINRYQNNRGVMKAYHTDVCHSISGITLQKKTVQTNAELQKISEINALSSTFPPGPETFTGRIQAVWTIQSLLPVENQTGMSIGTHGPGTCIPATTRPVTYVPLGMTLSLADRQALCWSDVWRAQIPTQQAVPVLHRRLPAFPRKHVH